MPQGCFSANLDNLSTSETVSIAPRTEILGHVVVLLRFKLAFLKNGDFFFLVSHPAGGNLKLLHTFARKLADGCGKKGKSDKGVEALFCNRTNKMKMYISILYGDVVSKYCTCKYRCGDAALSSEAVSRREIGHKQ